MMAQPYASSSAAMAAQSRAAIRSAVAREGAAFSLGLLRVAATALVSSRAACFMSGTPFQARSSTRPLVGLMFRLGASGRRSARPSYVLTETQEPRAGAHTVLFKIQL